MKQICLIPILVVLFFLLTPLPTLSLPFAPNLTEIEGTSKIIGGESVLEHVYPYMASFRRLELLPLGWTNFCAGAVIHEEWILTAASCFDGLNLFPRVLVGTNSQSSGGITYSISKVVKSPTFNPITRRDNIALVQVSGNMLFDPSVNYVEKINLIDSDRPDGTTCFLTGWGVTSPSALVQPDLLQRLTYLTILKQNCINELQGAQYPVFESNVCALAHPVSSSAGRGDMGGPLVLAYELRELLGVLSWGRTPNANWDTPEVFTSVVPFRSWIWETIDSMA